MQEKDLKKFPVVIYVYRQNGEKKALRKYFMLEFPSESKLISIKGSALIGLDKRGTYVTTGSKLRLKLSNDKFSRFKNGEVVEHSTGIYHFSNNIESLIKAFPEIIDNFGEDNVRFVKETRLYHRSGPYHKE